MENLFDLSKLDSRFRGYFVDAEGKVYSNKLGFFRALKPSAPRNGYNKYWNFSANGRAQAIRIDRFARMLGLNDEYRSFAKAAKAAKELAAVAADSAATPAAMSNGFIVGTVLPHGVSFSDRPKVHTTEASARAECERLAILNKGKTFMYVEIKGSVKASGVNWS